MPPQTVFSPAERKREKSRKRVRVELVDEVFGERKRAGIRDMESKEIEREIQQANEGARLRVCVREFARERESERERERECTR